MRRLAPRLLACACLLASAAQARPFSIDDLLARQRLGPVAFSPSGRWLVMQSTAPYGAIARYDLAEFADRTVSRLDVVETPNGAPRRLFADDGYGYLAGPFSPSGEMMAVTRVRGRDQELGLVTLATGKATWTGLTPLDNLFGSTLQWLDETTVVAIDRAPATLGFVPNNGWQLRERLTAKWASAAAGRSSLIAVGSGRYLGVEQAPSARRLVRIDVRTGKAQILYEGEAFDLQISPDHRRVALMAAAEPLQPDPAPLAGTAEPFRRHRLVIVDLAAKARWSPLADHEVALDLLSWSPDGRELLVYAKPDAKDWSAAAYWRVDAARHTATMVDLGGLTVAVGSNTHGMRIPRGQWMGADPILPATAGERQDWYRIGAGGPIRLTGALPNAARLAASSDREAVFTDAARVWRVTPDGKASPVAGKLAPGPAAPAGERMAVNDKPAPAALLLAAPAPSGASLVQPLESKAATVRARTEGVVVPDGETVLASTTMGLAVSRRTDPRGVQTVVFRNGAANPRPLLTLNTHLASVEPPIARPIVHLGPDGQRLTSWLYLPPRTAPSGPPPLIVVPYPGHVEPAAAKDLPAPNGYDYPNPFVLAGAGYAVLAPSLPIQAAREPMAGQADDILRVVDAVAASGAPVDTKRLALWGHSYGAYGVLAAATQSPRNMAVIAAAASPDLFAAYGRGAMSHGLTGDVGWGFNNAAGWLETGQARLGAAPWQDPAKYVRNSPMLHADKITAPVLIITGDFDGDAVGGRAMFNALYRQKKDALLLTYYAEGHQMAVSENLRDLYARAFSFLSDQLAPAKAASGG